jgi:hypothetical protein
MPDFLHMDVPMSREHTEVQSDSRSKYHYLKLSKFYIVDYCLYILRNGTLAAKRRTRMFKCRGRKDMQEHCWPGEDT